MMRSIAGALSALLIAVLPAAAQDPDPADWDAVVAQAAGQTVYFNAWGGSPDINAYLEWTAGELRERFAIELVHVRLEDAASAVASVLAEKSAGRDEDGTIDLIWINGENFAAMKSQDLLFAPGWAEALPNRRYVDTQEQPGILTDFTIPVDGLESPWGMAKLVFFHDEANTPADTLPLSAAELLDWAGENPGRFTYPRPPDFIGSTFLKQVLSELADDDDVLLEPADKSNFDAVTEPLFSYLDELNPLLWRQGRAYPANYPAMRQLLADNEVDIVFAFNPAEASAAIANDELPDTVRSFTFPDGTLGNTHFVSIPYNSSAKAAALVTADFLLSPEAQARKQDPAVWGDPTVLAMDLLSDEDRAAFEALDLGVATLTPEELGPVIDEPHPSWMERLEDEWVRRYGAGN